MESSPLSFKQITLRLFIRTLGGLFILFGSCTFISLFIKPPDITFRKIYFIFYLIILGLASLVAGYKLIRLDETGRKFSSILTLAILPFMIRSTKASLTDQRSKFSYEIWTFRGEYFSPNASLYYYMFDKLLLGIVVLGIILVLFLSSQTVKSAFNNQTNFSFRKKEISQ